MRRPQRLAVVSATRLYSLSLPTATEVDPTDEVKADFSEPSAHVRFGPSAVITGVHRSIDPQARAELVVIHPGKIVPRINVPCLAEEELLERSARART